MLDGLAGDQIHDRLGVEDEAVLVERVADPPQPHGLADVVLELGLALLAIGDVNELGVERRHRSIVASYRRPMQQSPRDAAVRPDEALLGGEGVDLATEHVLTGATQHGAVLGRGDRRDRPADELFPWASQQPAHRVVDPDAGASHRVRQGHPDRRRVESLAEQVLGGEPLALGRALLGDVEDRAPEVLATAVGLGDRLGVHRQDPRGAAGQHHAVLTAHRPVPDALLADPGHELAVGGMDELQVAVAVQRASLFELHQGGQPGRVGDLAGGDDQLPAPHADHALGLAQPALAARQRGGHPQVFGHVLHDRHHGGDGAGAVARGHELHLVDATSVLSAVTEGLGLSRQRRLVARHQDRHGMARKDLIDRDADPTPGIEPVGGEGASLDVHDAPLGVSDDDGGGADRRIGHRARDVSRRGQSAALSVIPCPEWLV